MGKALGVTLILISLPLILFGGILILIGVIAIPVFLLAGLLLYQGLKQLAKEEIKIELTPAEKQRKQEQRTLFLRSSFFLQVLVFLTSSVAFFWSVGIYIWSLRGFYSPYYFIPLDIFSAILLIKALENDPPWPKVVGFFPIFRIAFFVMPIFSGFLFYIPNAFYITISFILNIITICVVFIYGHVTGIIKTTSKEPGTKNEVLPPPVPPSSSISATTSADTIQASSETPATSKEFTYCAFCGMKNPFTSTFCKECGKRLAK